MNEQELHGLIKCIHKIWYSDWLDSPELAIKLHDHMGKLFNHADITDTLCENNPDEVSPDEFKKIINKRIDK